MQDVVDAIRKFGRIPKQNQGTSEEERSENKLAKRFSDYRDSISDDVLQELKALGGAPQPAAMSSSMRQLVEEVELADARQNSQPARKEISSETVFPQRLHPSGHLAKAAAAQRCFSAC